MKDELVMHDFENGIFLRYFLEKKFRYWRHIVFLLSLLFFCLSTNFEMPSFIGCYRIYYSLLVWFVIVSLFYFNMYVLLPLFFFKRRYELYVLLLTLAILGCLIILAQISVYIHSIHPFPIIMKPITFLSFIDGLFICFPFILVTTTFKLLKRWIADSKRISELKNMALSAELTVLKNQIQPHFLFNMLNNIKVLIKKDAELATQVVIKLSDFLRYQLYENNSDKTLLKTEINFISNFLKLEELRRDHLSTTVTCTSELANKNFFIPSHLFTTFVENAIKHSLGSTEKDAFIHVGFFCGEERLYFECENSKGVDSFAAKTKYSGVGLANVRRKLELLYKNNYTLDIKSGDTTYYVKLTVPL